MIFPSVSAPALENEGNVLRLHSEISGNERGPVVLLLHGFLGSHRDWDTVVDALNDRYRCVAVDLPGHGRSLDDSESYSMETAATAIIELMDTLGADSFSMVGYSLGGRVALYIASIYAMRIDALVLESTSPGLRTEAERAARSRVDAGWVEQLGGDLKAFLDAWYQQPLFATLALRPELLKRLMRSRLQGSPQHLIRALRGFSVASQPPLWDEWRANHVPALLVTGEQDKKYFGVMAEMQDCNSAASLAIIDGAGHNVHVEAPDAYNRAVRQFLDHSLRAH